jgi:beta-glucosidase
MRAAGMHQALAPLMDVTRDPRWGRVEETYGEDPYLVSRMATSYVKGLQGEELNNSVAATGKHFVGYGNSEGGMNWAPAHIPPRELREIFLAPFEAAVREGGLASIMPGYHELDGVPCHASKDLLEGVLRKEWGFDGIVVSDYFAITQLHEYHNMAKDLVDAARMALEAGVDVELPNTDCCGHWLIDGVKKGIIDIAIVDKAVSRLLKMKFRLGLFEKPFVDASSTANAFDTQEHRRLAYKIALESMVLLKNNNNILPLKSDLKSIAILGPNADNIRNMLGDYTYPAHIETLIEVKETDNTLGQPVPEDLDTSNIHLPEMISILDAIKTRVSKDTKVNYAKGCEILGDSKEGFDEAVNVAKASEIALIFVGDKAGLIRECSVGESRDRAVLDLPGVQEELVKAVVATGTPVIVVLVNGRPFGINWIQENVPAVLEAWLPGEEGASALADVLFGEYCPGGKLTISFPRNAGQVPVYYYHKKSGGRSHWRGDYVETSTKPLYPFGYGKSYTSFEYSNFRISSAEVAVDGKVDISMDIKNTGSYKGDEIVQLYTNDKEASVTRPVMELKGFKRISLIPGETKTVTFTLSPKQLGFYDMSMDFVVEPGDINVMVGSSSEDIKARGSFKITGEKTEIGKNKEFFSLVKAL